MYEATLLCLGKEMMFDGLSEEMDDGPRPRRGYDVKQHHVNDDISNRNMAETTLVYGKIAWWITLIIVVCLVVGLSSLLLFLAVL